MAKSKIINWPTQTTLTARSSTLTSSFVHTITPWLTSLTPTEEAEVRKIYTEIEDKYNIKILGADRSENRCAYCGREAASTDHINALVNNKTSSGAITEIYNLLPCCSSCNSSKGKKTFWVYLCARAPFQVAVSAINAVLSIVIPLALKKSLFKEFFPETEQIEK